MNYHIAREGQQIGVFPEDEVRAKIREGSIKPDDLVWAAGMADWKAASEVFADAVSAPAAASGSKPEPAPPPAIAQPPTTAGAAAGAVPPKPENYLVWAILATVLCCLPLGIVSIIFAAQVDSKYRAGDYQGALESSRKAKTFAWWSFGVGLAVIVLTVVAQVIAGIVAASQGY